MENFDNFNQGNNQNPNVRINPYTGEPMPNQGGSQGYNPNQSYNSDQGFYQPQQTAQESRNPYSSEPDFGSHQSSYNQSTASYNQSSYNQNSSSYNQDPFQARANASGRSYPQNNYQQNYNRGNYQQSRYNSYGGADDKRKGCCGCALSVMVAMIVFAIVVGFTGYRFIADHLDEIQEYTSNSSTSSTSSQTDETTTEELTEAAETKYPDLADSDTDCHGLSSDDPATTMDEVVETFIYLIKSGVEDEATIYISGLTTDDLITINSYPEFIKYAISDRHSTTLLGSSGTVTYTFKVNDSFYVERYFLEGVDIPSGKPEAVALADAVEEFNGTYITSDMTDYDKELAIHDYLVDTVTYGNQTNIIENEHEAYGALCEHSAVCEGYAKAFQLLCTVNGIECKYITGETDEAHGWNLVNLNGVWYHVDVTWDDPVDTSGTDENTFAGYLSHAYFNVSDEVLSQDGHTWDKANYPAANSMAMNYYTVNGNLATDYDTFANSLAANAYSGNLAEIAVMDYNESTYDVVSTITNYTSYYGGYSWAYSRNLSNGFQVIVISFD